MKYKYTLKLIATQRKIYMGALIQDVCGVSRPTASQYLNIKIDDHRSIPSDHLRAIAKSLQVQMEDLYTQPVEI